MEEGIESGLGTQSRPRRSLVDEEERAGVKAEENARGEKWIRRRAVVVVRR